MIYVKAVLIGAITAAIGCALLNVSLIALTHRRMAAMDNSGLHAISGGFWFLKYFAIGFFLFGSLAFVLLRR
jgi:hypothetical protein